MTGARLATEFEVPMDSLESSAQELLRAGPDTGGAPDSAAEAQVLTERLCPVIGALMLVRAECIRKVDASGQAKTAGHSSTFAWATANGRMPRGEAGAAKRHGKQLERLPRVREAFTDGRLTWALLTQILTAVEAIKPGDDIDLAMVESALLQLALETADVRRIRICGQVLRQLLDPDGHLDDHDKAHRKRHLTVRDEEDGGISGFFYLPPEWAELLRAALAKCARPTGPGDDRTQHQRNADVFIGLLTAAVKAQVVILVNADTLPDDEPEPTTDGSTGNGSGNGRADGYADSRWSDSTGPDSTAEPPAPTPPTRPTGPTGAGDDRAGDSDSAESGPDPGDGDGDSPDSENGDGDRDELDRDGLTRDERIRQVWSMFRRPQQPAPCRTCGQYQRRDLPAVMLASGQTLPAPQAVRRLHTSTLYRMCATAPDMQFSAAFRQVPARAIPAIRAKYPHCCYDDCNVPAEYCELEHVFAWAIYHRTRLDEIGLACDYHNRDRAARPDKYHLQRLPDGRWHFKTTNRYRT